jgi:hypothetical protein
MQTVDVVGAFITVCGAWSNEFLAFEMREDGKVWGLTVFYPSAWRQFRYGEAAVPARETWDVIHAQPTPFASMKAALDHQTNLVIFAQ